MIKSVVVYYLEFNSIALEEEFGSTSSGASLFGLYWTMISCAYPVLGFRMFML